MTNPVVTSQLGWLGLGALLMLFTNGSGMVPILVWFAPAAWLIYLDRGGHWLQLPFLLAANVLVNFVVWRGIIPAPGLLYYLVAGIYALVYFLPFVAHRLLAAGKPSFAATLVFPAAWVALEFVFQRWVTPYGSWASFAYTQADSLPVIQLASIGGIAGLSFLMTWLASVIAWCMRSEPGPQRRLRGVLVGGFVLLAALAFGHIRLAQPVDDGEVLRVAGLAPDILLDQEVGRVVNEVRSGAALSPERMRRLERAAERLNADLLERTRIEARAGARLVAWSETAARLLKSDQEPFLARLASLAQEEGIYVLAAMGVWNPGGQPLLENKVVALDPAGRVAFEFHKARPIVGAESMLIEAGDGKIGELQIEGARLGLVICHDLDFPGFLRQASNADLDLLVAPSNDWPLIAKLHADMAKMRAVENGVTLFRPTSGGKSIAVDGKGRSLAVVDHPANTIVAFLPVNGNRTIHGIIGESFSWLCVFALLAMFGITIVSKRRES
ncbi:MAG: hypothetical protein KJO72_10840 [Gammaproteobacteria bacterium]|nr:hypothetical protein [Gammaproteobacteria bacterium]